MNESRKVAIRVGTGLIAYAIGYALFGTELKYGPFPAFALCGFAGIAIGYLFTSSDSETKSTSSSAYASAPMAHQSSLSEEKTCPACISQVPFIASKCKFCGIDLIVEDLSHIKKALEDTERKEREAENNRRRAEEDAERLQKERTALEQSEKERLRKEHLESLSPLKRFLTVRKVPLALTLIGIVISALIIPGQVSKARDASQIEQIRQQAKQSAALAEESERTNAVANAEKNIADLEAQYCLLLNAASKDSAWKRYFDTGNFQVPQYDVFQERYVIPMTIIYTKYTSLGVILGADKGKYASSILELHITSWGYKGDFDAILSQCSAY